MDPLEELVRTCGFFTRAQARDSGVAERDICQLLRSGEWQRFRRGYYTFATTWAALDPVGRHRVRCTAVLHSLGDAVILSHVSSLVGHAVDTWGMDLSRVHVTRLDKGAGRIEGDVVHHVAAVPPQHIDGDLACRRTAVDRALIEAGSTVSGESALVAFESALHKQLLTPDELLGRFHQMEHWPRTQHLHIPVRMATPRSESVGESRGNWMFWALHLPRPQSQFPVADGDGRVVATCDWGWPDLGTLGEFDGRVKYGRLLKPGQEPGDVVFAEKQREDEVRRITGFTMVRFVWSDYDRPRLCEQRLRRAFELKTG